MISGFRKKLPDKWEYLIEIIAYLHEYFNSIGDYQKPVNILRKDEFFSKIKEMHVLMINGSNEQKNYRNFQY